MSQPVSIVKDVAEIYCTQVNNGEIKPFPSEEGIDDEI